MSDRRGLEHQCRLPGWWRKHRSRIGRRWTCRCGKTWQLGHMYFPPGLPGAPTIKEWKPGND